MSQAINAAERYQQAANAVAAGRLDKADRLLKKNLKKDPRHFESQFLLGLISEQRERYEVARSYFQQALRLQPAHAETHLHIAYCLSRTPQSGDDPKVTEHFRLCEEHGGASYDLYYQWGWFLHVHSHYKEAAAKLQQAQPYKPASAELYEALSLTYWRLYRYDDAERCITKAFAMTPNSVSVMLNWLKMSEVLHTMAKQALQMAKLSTEPRIKIFLAARLLLEDKQWDQAIEYFSRVDPGDSIYLRVMLCHYLGRAHESKQDFATAIRYFFQANEFAKQSVDAQAVDKNLYFAALSTQAQIFQQADWVQRCNRHLAQRRNTIAANQHVRPSLHFLVGFPRSGTTLLGQILNAHPRIYVADEVPALSVAFKEFLQISGVSMENLYELREEDRRRLCDCFWSEHRENPLWEDDVDLVIDKMPLNMTMVPFIRMLFPQARFLYIQRHPLDAILSGFMQHFVMNDAMYQFLDFSRATQLFNETYRCFQMAGRSLEGTQVLTLKYEELVESFEGVMRPVLDFIDVEWDDAMREFHQQSEGTTRTNTPSSSQVNQPLYTTARERWRSYAPYLAPDVFEAIRPVAEEMGYALDWQVAPSG